MQTNKLSKDEMQKIHKRWEQTNEMKHHSLESDALALLFNKFPNHTNISEVIWKVGCLDNFYNTNATKYVKIPDIAEKIISIKDFDLRLQKWDKDLVSELATFSKEGKQVKLYSFATKYCTLHNHIIYKRDDYAIYDSIVRKMLSRFNKEYNFAEFSSKDFDLENYSKYVEILDNFRKKFGLNCSFRELDWYLWRLGKLEGLETSQIYD